MKNRNLTQGMICALMTLAPSVLWAQTPEEQNLDLIEAEFQKKPPAAKPPPEVKSEIPMAPGTIAPSASEVSAVTGNAPTAERANKLSDLSKLQPFSDVSVLQKRYMPKTSRVQFFGGLALNMNDPWNTSYGENVRVGFNFTEAWGVEAIGYFMNTSPSTAANDLQSQHQVSAQTFGTMTGFTGGAVTWAPIYGKMSYGNSKIIPFDMYFSAGAGSTGLSGTTISSASAFTLGTGQIYAVTRAVGFRWDLTYSSYSVPLGSANNILLTFGMNLYVPEAKYR
jgi:outer membrane beta-barrel protein